MTNQGSLPTEVTSPESQSTGVNTMTTTNAPNKNSRARNAETTKQVILQCARTSFAGNSYDAVGLREIAAAAKIDPALIIRYFGSKEGLFREVLSQDLFTQGLALMNGEQFLEELIAWTLKPPQNPESMTALLVILRSVTSETASPIIKNCIQQRILDPMSKNLPGDNGQERAEMLIAILVGLATYRQVLKLDKLSDENYDRRIAKVTPFLKNLLNDKL